MVDIPEGMKFGLGRTHPLPDYDYLSVNELLEYDSRGQFEEEWRLIPDVAKQEVINEALESGVSNFVLNNLATTQYGISVPDIRIERDRRHPEVVWGSGEKHMYGTATFVPGRTFIENVKSILTDAYQPMDQYQKITVATTTLRYVAVYGAALACYDSLDREGLIPADALDASNQRFRFAAGISKKRGLDLPEEDIVRDFTDAAAIKFVRSPKRNETFTELDPASDSMVYPMTKIDIRTLFAIVTERSAVRAIDVSTDES